jgi:hypothetical protein
VAGGDGGWILFTGGVFGAFGGATKAAATPASGLITFAVAAGAGVVAVAGGRAGEDSVGTVLVAGSRSTEALAVGRGATVAEASSVLCVRATKIAMIATVTPPAIPPPIHLPGERRSEFVCMSWTSELADPRVSELPTGGELATEGTDPT